MTINMDYETEIKLGLDYETIISKIVSEAVDYEKCPYETEVNVLLTDNTAIHTINLEQRGIDAPTDVLSFPAVSYKVPADFSTLEQRAADCFNPDSGELLLGDIVISVEKVIAQAEEYGHSIERELGFLTAHSMLHLFGYDHMEETERETMEQKQRDILNKAGLKR